MTSHSRPGRDEYFLRGAEWARIMSTCLRRSVGCILVNERGHILGTGYNGVESGAPHCNQEVEVGRIRTFETARNQDVVRIITERPYACKGADLPSGQGLDQCDAIHAEQNALLQCGDVFQIHTCYVTHSPCVHCVKLLMGTSCLRIVFREKYAHDEPARLKWLKRNENVQYVAREWVHIPGER